MDLLTIDPPGRSLGTIVFLHGLGANGYDFEPVAQQLMPVLPMRWVLPHAPEIPVTINAGYRMPAWYDITSLERADGVEWGSVARTREAVRALLEEESARAPSRLLLGGFSQGGAIALHCAFDAPVPLHGIVALSTYLLCENGSSGLPAGLDAASAPPVFMAHGTYDPTVPPELAERGRDALRAAGISLEWRTYPMGHSLCPREAQDLVTWLAGRLK